MTAAASAHGSTSVLIWRPRRQQRVEGVVDEPVERDHARATSDQSARDPSSRTASGMSVAKTCATLPTTVYSRSVHEPSGTVDVGSFWTPTGTIDGPGQRGAEHLLQPGRRTADLEEHIGLDARARASRSASESVRRARVGGAERACELEPVGVCGRRRCTRAPVAAAANVMNEPMPPMPTTTASSPGRRPLRRTTCTAIDIGWASPSVSAASPESVTSSRMRGGHRHVAGETAVDLEPAVRYSRHRFVRPAAARLAVAARDARAAHHGGAEPGAVTPSPTASTTPANSWPSTTGGVVSRAPVEFGGVRAAHAAHRDADERLAGPGLGDRPVLDAQVAHGVEHRRAHAAHPGVADIAAAQPAARSIMRPRS